jgi:hypothetical protein
VVALQLPIDSFGPRFSTQAAAPTKQSLFSSKAPGCKPILLAATALGVRLTGCLPCNLWSSGNTERWIRLSEGDLAALHHLRYGNVPLPTSG